MLLHDSYFASENKKINETHYHTIIIAYSPLFHSTFTLIISVFGLLFNLICCIKLWFIINQCRKRKLENIQPQQWQNFQDSMHILSHNKYRFLFVLTSNDLLLCLSSIISCVDEKFFFQSLLARLHLCAVHTLIWKFTLHLVPLLTVFMLCRYHYRLNEKFQVTSSNVSTLKQLLCTDLSILIPFVLAVSWSIDGLWLWGVTDIENFTISGPSFIDEGTSQNGTMIIVKSTAMDTNNMNTTVSSLDLLSIQSEKKTDDNLHLTEQKRVCHLQTNHNFQFTARLVHLIQIDFLLLFSLHSLGKRNRSIIVLRNNVYFCLLSFSSRTAFTCSFMLLCN